MTITRGIQLDRSRYPLVVLRFPREFTDAEFQAMTVSMSELFRSGPFGLINDTRGAPVPTAKQRRAIIQQYEENDRDIRTNFLACAVVGESALLRGVLTALNWVRPAPHPVEVFAGIPEAEEWVTSHFPDELARRVPRARGPLDQRSG
jgi:hypothetical protein